MGALWERANSERSFVVYATAADGPVVVRDLTTLEGARVESLAAVPETLREFLAESADETPAPRRDRVAQLVPPLTPSEARVAALALEGVSNKGIAAALGVRLRTVETHLTSAYRKLGVRSRRELRRAIPPSPG